MKITETWLPVPFGNLTQGGQVQLEDDSKSCPYLTSGKPCPGQTRTKLSANKPALSEILQSISHKVLYNHFVGRFEVHCRDNDFSFWSSQMWKVRKLTSSTVKILILLWEGVSPHYVMAKLCLFSKPAKEVAGEAHFELCGQHCTVLPWYHISGPQDIQQYSLISRTKINTFSYLWCLLAPNDQKCVSLRSIFASRSLEIAGKRPFN